jgi:hypothetical protein
MEKDTFYGGINLGASLANLASWRFKNVPKQNVFAGLWTLLAFIRVFCVICGQQRNPPTLPITQISASSAVPFGCGLRPL